MEGLAKMLSLSTAKLRMYVCSTFHLSTFRKGWQEAPLCNAAQS